MADHHRLTNASRPEESNQEESRDSDNNAEAAQTVEVAWVRRAQQGDSNAFGDLVWCLSRDTIMMGCDGPEVPSVNGDDVTVAYGGPLEPGMYYQFRATSWRQAGMQSPGPISTTEDLRGVFFVPLAQE